MFSSILAAWIIWKTIKVIKDITNINSLSYILYLISYILFIFFSLKFFQPQFKYPTSAAELTSRERLLWEISRRSDEYLPLGFIRPNSLEEALRVDNPVNQQLVDALKQPTPVRRLGNIISVITVIGMIGYTIRKLGKLRNPDTLII
jgi:hypothetical protein